MNPFQHGRLRVSDNRRFLQHADGTPFFYQADTAWELFHRLTREEMKTYFAARASQGFNAVQCVFLAEEDGIRVPNREGHLPLVDEDPTRPNEPYWELVDFAFDLAASYGITLAALPTWGDKIVKIWGRGPQVFDDANALAYGKFVGARYGSRENLIWVIGGDRPTVHEGEDRTDVYRHMAHGIRGSEAFPHLMTFHPMGGRSSSESWPNEDWLDFHMIQSGHWWYDVRADEFVDKDYALQPIKPTLDGEPCYENHRPFRAIGELKDLSCPAFSDYHVRRASYWSVFAGGCGITYGCHAVWQMAAPQFSPVNHPIGTWWQSLDLAGANQLHHLKDLIVGKSYFDRIPDDSVIAEGRGEGAETARATRSATGDWALIYIPLPRPIKVDRSKLKEGLAARWFDPRTGRRTDAVEADGFFHAPTATDWVLELSA
jgi:hypothetical protein